MTDNRKMRYVRHPVAGLVPIPATVNSGYFEERVVRCTLKKLRLTGYLSQIYEKQEQLTGYRRLTFDALHLVVQDLGFYFRAHYTTRMGEKFQLLPALKGKFESQQVFRTYYEERRDTPEQFAGMPFVLVVKWPYLQNGMAIHSRGDTGDTGFRMIYRAKRKLLCLEPLEQFLSSLGARWTHTPIE